MILFASWRTGSPDWLVPAALLMLAAIGLIIWSYFRSGRSLGVRLVAASLKVLGFASLAACLIEPLWSGTRAKPGANLFLIVADNSQSMNVLDRSADKTRGELLRATVTGDQADWQVRLEQDFEVRRYLFDTRVHSSSDFRDLSFDGRGSSLYSTVTTLTERFRGRPLAGVLLFTDGNATDLADESEPSTALPPIYPVVVGATGPSRDVAISNVAVTQTAFEDSPVTVRVDVQTTGYGRASIIAQLLDEQGEKQAEEMQNGLGDDQPIAFRLSVRPPTAGVSFYTVRVSAESELEQFDRPDRSIEATLVNNERLVTVDRGAERYDVLYVAGRPNWEFKFLRRAIDEDSQVRLLGMIRVAKREAKFAFRSQDTGRSNPLFRGFDKANEEEAERYDEPVLVRLNTLDLEELRDGFPKTREGLYKYHAVIVDDLESQFFSPEQMALLRRFVSERGGGFLMLGGQESFRQGKYERTPIEELLPVYLDQAPQSQPGDRMRLDLTREGWLQPWVRLRDNEMDEKSRLRDMPDFRTVNRTSGTKPGASVLATVSDAGGRSYPALAAQRFGRGRSAALLVGDFWRWALRHDPEHRDLEKSWRQLVRWLVADVPEPIEVRAEPVRESGAELVRLVTRVRTPEFEPNDSATVLLNVVQPDGATISLASEPSLRESGAYETEFAARQAGAYRAEARVTNEQGESIGVARTGWAADPAAIEFQSLGSKRDELERLAKRSGGELVDEADLSNFVASLPTRKVPVVEQWTYPLWHRTPVFAFAIVCLIGEWAVRRWKGLA